SVLFEVSRADLCFREIWIRTVTASCDNRRCVMATVKVICMVEPCFQYRRRTAVILRCAQHDNGVGGPGFVSAGPVANFPVQIRPIDGQRDRYGETGKGSPLE